MGGQLQRIIRYPIKSVQGESLEAAELRSAGVAGDRIFAVEDRASGFIASAKRPVLWGALLSCRAYGLGEDAAIALPSGETLPLSDLPRVEALLAELLDRPVGIKRRSNASAHIERSDPVVDRGELHDELDLGDVSQGQLGGAAPGSFFDFAPLHLITSSTLCNLREQLGDDAADARRFRVNLVLDVDAPPFAEHGWAERRIAVGDAVVEVLTPTPRCIVPTLPQRGGLCQSPATVRFLARDHRVAIPGLPKPLPCLGAYARVLRPARIATGATVRFADQYPNQGH